jgi:RNA polymerase sigma-70 factor (ECF subfamily)
MGEDAASPGAFQPTRWSLVARAAGPPEPAARAALDDLCRAYWYPLYAFLRRRGRSPEDAEDLVQGFLGEVIEKGRLARADPARGRFRTFLLASLDHHAAHERERALARKRGGGRAVVSFDAAEGERRYAMEPATEETAERLFERRFAFEVLDRAIARTAARARGGTPERAERFDALLPLLWDGGPPQQEVAERLAMTETALRVALHRLRAQVREEIRSEVLDTLGDPADLDDEIRRLAGALRAGPRPAHAP